MIAKPALRSGLFAFAATGALDRIGALYGVEAEIRGKPPDERRANRQARAAPLLAELRARMEKTRKRLVKPGQGWSIRRAIYLVRLRRDDKEPENPGAEA